MSYFCTLSKEYLPPNKAFSERHPEMNQNASFSRQISTFHRFFISTARRSFVENDRPPSFQGELDRWALRSVRF
jgi:hypothetical protein